jgi:mono/diheme cytochrome c family protein
MSGISIVTKFVFWSVLLLVLTIYVVASSAWNNQATTTRDYIYWQNEYKNVAAALAPDAEVKQATLDTAVTVNQITVLQFPFMQADGTNQQRVDRCQSCHTGLENPSMTAENIIKTITDGKVNLKADQVEAYLLDPKNKEVLTAVKVLSAHPGKTGGIIKGALPFALATGTSATPGDADSNKQLTEVMSKHAFATYGCTTCHYGSGRELQEGNAHGTANEAWLQPLMPSKYMDAACAQCHTTHKGTDSKAVYLPQMKTIAQGQDLFKTNACWGCHKVEGFSKGNVGPELTLEGNIARYETIEHQLWDPRYKVNNCVMPYFFSKKIITDFDAQGNAHDFYLNDFGDKRPLSELKAANIEYEHTKASLEAHGYVADAAYEPTVTALVTYILSQTGMNYAESQGQRIARITSYNVATPPDVPKTIEQGKLLFEQSGCYACHFLGDPQKPRNGKGGGIAPNLSWEGSRHSYQWIEEHYRNPQEFVPKSIMPIFPFSDSQRAALTLFDASRMAPGARPVSADQDMAGVRYPKDKAITNKTPNPQVRYMTR